MLLHRVMKFSHNLIDFRDDWAVSARSRKVSRMKECGDAATIRGGEEVGGRVSLAAVPVTGNWSHGQSPDPNAKGEAHRTSPATVFRTAPARGGSAPDQRPICGWLRCWKSPCHSRLAWAACCRQAGWQSFPFSDVAAANTSRQVEREEPDRVASAK